MAYGGAWWHQRILTNGSLPGLLYQQQILVTVYKLLKEATEKYGIPSRVRSDKGGENVLVCHNS